MGLFDLFSTGDAGSAFDTSSFVSGLLDDAGTIFGSGGSANGGYPAPVSVGYGGQAYPVMGSAPAVISRAGALVGASLRNFPSLANSIAALRARGIKATTESLWGMLKKFGPTALESGGFMTAAAISDLMYYKSTHKRRRMNPANTKALRRSLRRLGAFDRLSSRVSHQLASSCSRRGRKCKK